MQWFNDTFSVRHQSEVGPFLVWAKAFTAPRGYKAGTLVSSSSKLVAVV